MKSFDDTPEVRDEDPDDICMHCDKPLYHDDEIMETDDGAMCMACAENNGYI